MVRMSKIPGLTLILFLTLSSSAVANVPTLADMGANPEQTARIAGDRQLAVLQHPRSFVVDGEAQDVRFATSIAVINAPVTTVTQTVLAFADYPDFVPQAKKVEIMEQSEKEWLIDYTLEFELPVRDLTVDYVLHYKLLEDGGIEWDLVRGDMDGNAGRWEFFPLAGERTLAVYTVWSDLRSMGFTMRILLRAQPDLQLALPIANASIVLDAVQRRAEGLPLTDPAPESVERTAPAVPLVSDDDFDVPTETLRHLADSGTVLFIHPRQWIQTSDGPLDLIFVSAIVLVDEPVEKTRHYSRQFPRFGEFFDQVRRADITETEDGMHVDWRIRLGFGILSVNIDYELAYQQTADPNVLLFDTVEGDIEFIFGAWEWLPVAGNQSLASYTTVSEIGHNASATLRLANLLPNRKITVGVSTAGVIAEKIVAWIEAQPGLDELDEPAAF